MDMLNIQKGLKIGTTELGMLRRLIADTLLDFIGCRNNNPGIVMKTDADTSFQVSIDPASGLWSVAPGTIINHNNEIIKNIATITPTADSRPGELTAGENPITLIGSGWYIIVQTDNFTQNEDYGAIAVLASDNTIVGTNTEFTKYLSVGGIINIPSSLVGNAGDYVIDTITDDTHATITSTFAADESDLKFVVKGVYFEGYPPGDDKSLYDLNSFKFRLTDTVPELVDGEYILALAQYDDVVAHTWSVTDYRSGYRYAIPPVGASEINALAVTLAKMAANSVDENKIVSTAFDAAGGIAGGSGTKFKISPLGVALAMMGLNSVDENKIVSTTFGAGLEGGGGVKPKISNLGVVEAMLANLAVTLGKMANNSVDENKIVSTAFNSDVVTISGGSGNKIAVFPQPKFHAFRGTSLQDILNDALTKILFNGIIYGAGYYNGETGIFTAPRVGSYHFDIIVNTYPFTFPVTKFVRLYLNVNGTWAAKRYFYGNGGSFAWSFGLSVDLFLEALDTVYVQIIQDSGGTIQLNYSTGDTIFNGHLIL